jgi:Tfp pilus assembly protein FimV
MEINDWGFFPEAASAATFAKALIETRGKVSDAQFAAVRDAGGQTPTSSR